MKKIFASLFAFFTCMVVVGMMLDSIEPINTAYDPEKDAVVGVAFADLVSIPGYDYLYYSVETRTVFYLFADEEGYARSLGYMAPYIRNGNTCEYVDGEIVEVIPAVRIEDVTN